MCWPERRPPTERDRHPAQAAGPLIAQASRDAPSLARVSGEDPAVLWTRYVQLKRELGFSPVYHRREHRVDAHILIAFLTYYLQVTLENRLLLHAPESDTQRCVGKNCRRFK